MIRSVPGMERQRGTATYRFSALPDAGDFLKMVSVRPAGMSGSKFSESSLTTLCSPSNFSEANIQRIGSRDFLSYSIDYGEVCILPK